MRTLGQSGWEKVKAGNTTMDEVLRVITVAEK
jgi:type II secretory ATPase GspE/PulE/Tfp pilus assembly ATPase PilB-like protein